MNEAVSFPQPDPGQRGPRPFGQLAQIFQEAFTVAVRIRANRQAATDPKAFRRHVKQLLVAADGEARQATYDPANVRLAVYAYIAFLDESVLASTQPMFSEWARQPLQEEVFRHHTAGEIFFDNYRDLLARPDSHGVADVLEVYLLCLLLGFRGRYGSGESSELKNLMSQGSEKMRRIRGQWGDLSPSWAPPADEKITIAADPWMRRLTIGAAASFGVALVLFLLYTLLLRPGIREVITLTEGIAG